ncbi:MAG: tRNA 2-thiocytidine(32) synthetase TtcA [Oscillospiraceae bacterium]|nr:tRNA 2-thiocytidine(32) synthetase TtcA [Oscillospiraceae bacterium]
MQHVYSRVRRCIDDYGMIAPGDKIAVGVSGGKDSLLLLVALAGLRSFYPHEFTLHAICLDLGFPGVVATPLVDFCERLDVPFSLIKTDIAPVVFDIRKEPNPCSLCAKLRRGALHEAALERGCRKVALGHHADDAVETFWLSLLFEGRLSCFQPVTWLDRKDITLIRPLLYFWENEIISMKSGLPVIHNPCPAEGHTQRQAAKDKLKELEVTIPGARQKILGAMQRFPLMGWGIDKDGNE